MLECYWLDAVMTSLVTFEQLYNCLHPGAFCGVMKQAFNRNLPSCLCILVDGATKLLGTNLAGV